MSATGFSCKCLNRKGSDHLNLLPLLYLLLLGFWFKVRFLRGAFSLVASRLAATSPGRVDASRFDAARVVYEHCGGTILAGGELHQISDEVIGVRSTLRARLAVRRHSRCLLRS